MVYHTIEHYSAVRKREVDLYPLIWKDLQGKKYVQDAPVYVKYVYIFACIFLEYLKDRGETCNSGCF